MTLYELNKQGYLSVDNMSEEMLTEEKLKLADHLIETATFDGLSKIYYMLLCKEKNDYTVFVINNICGYNEIPIFEIVESRGSIKDIVYNDDDSVDFWILIDDEVFMYKLFHYNWGVIEID